MNSTLPTARVAWSAVPCRRALHSACVSALAALLASGCSSEGFALTEVDGGFVLGADTETEVDGSAEEVESTCSSGPGGTACPEASPRCLPSAAGGFACIAAGSVALGAVCAASGVDDCEVGAVCVKADDVEGWRCRALCEPVRPCASGTCTPLGPRGVSACLPVLP